MVLTLVVLEGLNCQPIPWKALEGWDQCDDVGWIGLELDQSYVNMSLIHASRRFLAQSRRYG